MTDTERNRIEAICEVANIKDIGDLSDGYHTFNQLYYQRMMLFAALVKQNRSNAWKSLRHEDGELCFGGGWFIVGIDTPEGSYTYHYEDKYFDVFDCEELERGKHWDGHTEKDVTRLLSLAQQSSDDYISKETLLKHLDSITKDTNPDHYECKDAWYQANGFNSCKVGIEMYVKNLPPVTSHPKTGRWIGLQEHCESIGAIPSGLCAYYWCSSCDYAVDAKVWSRNYYNFCPNCGVKMIEPQGR